MIRGEGFEEFRAWFLERKFKLLAMTLSVDIPWYQNPEQDIGTLANVRLRKNGSNAEMFVTRQELRYSGALRGNTKLIGNAVKR
jgi:hypothetical protein